MENADVVMGLVQELRTPMTSITGYVELLLAESAGILGEMQRQFLQRVGTNVNRLASMLDDLIRVTALDTGKFTISAVPVDVVALIEDAITNAAIQFREKGLAVNLELEENLPLLSADHDSVHQMIGQLLTNAYLVSPPNTEISVSAGMRSVKFKANDAPIDCLYVAVADRGGGILPEDAARVFARKYKAENPLIQGLGDTGVGMAVAKALVEAHGGRLWLDTQPEVGSVFQFVIPFSQPTQVTEEPA
jgi:signal transduction histidine kinase